MDKKSFKQHTKTLLSNKYFLASVAFVVWVGFFDQNNLIDRFKLSSRIKQLNKQKQLYIEDINQNNRKMEEIHGSSEKLEKFAREEYLMKKDNEVIFVVEEE